MEAVVVRKVLEAYVKITEEKGVMGKGENINTN